MINRRQMLSGGAALTGALAASPLLPAWARSASQAAAPPSLGGTEFDLEVDHLPLRIDGRRTTGVGVNGTVPAPLLRWREGDEITLRVTNRLAVDTSIHWHGILLPFQMDGVPGVSFPGIRPGETFTYRFPVRQTGTYWYHSHSGLQEQAGHYGPIIIEPAGGERIGFDREHVLVLSDWTFLKPHDLFAQLKKNPESLNFQKRTAATFFGDAREQGLGETLDDRLMWSRMRMAPNDIADVGGETYTYLVNGHGPEDNWTGLFRPGERVRLRIINASAMTLFNLRIPGLPMTVVQSDGLDVQPLEVDEFQIGVAETYDVIVTPPDDRAYTIMAETIDRSGYGRATLAPRPGMSAPLPPRRDPPLLTMKDMGMAHHGGHGPTGSSHAQHSAGHGGHMAATTTHDHPDGPGVANLAAIPLNRLDEPGLGLEDVPHRTLTYAMLRSLDPNPDTRAPEREIEIHLTSNMHRYMWSFEGVKFSQVVDPIVFHEGERVRMTLVNDTMMSHPIHLHGMFFDLVNGGGGHMPRKHTIIVKPAEKLSVDITANEVGDWAFHCHLLYHMHAGMMQVVSVLPATGPAMRTAPASASPTDDHPPHHHDHMGHGGHE